MLMNLLFWKFNYAEIIQKMCVNTCVYRVSGYYLTELDASTAVTPHI